MPVKDPSADDPTPTSRTIALASGGSLTFTAAVNLFALSSEDRQLLFQFVDAIDAYAKAHAAPPASAAEF
jgi:hypothetical protein